MAAAAHNTVAVAVVGNSRLVEKHPADSNRLVRDLPDGTGIRLEEVLGYCGIRRSFVVDSWAAVEERNLSTGHVVVLHYPSSCYPSSEEHRLEDRMTLLTFRLSTKNTRKQKFNSRLAEEGTLALGDSCAGSH